MTDESFFHNSEILDIFRYNISAQDCLDLIQKALIIEKDESSLHRKCKKSTKTAKIKKIQFIGGIKFKDPNSGMASSYLNYLFPLKNVVEFDLYDYQFNETSLLIDLLKSWDNLKTLKLDCRALSTEDIVLLMKTISSRKIPNLSIYGLKYSNINIISSCLEQGFLKTLGLGIGSDVESISISHDDLKQLTDSIYKSNLQSLDLSLHHGLESIKPLVEMLEYNCSLKSLNLFSIPVEFDDFKMVMKKNFFLRELRIGELHNTNQSYSPEELEKLSAFLREVKGLEVFHLFGNTLIDLQAITHSAIKHFVCYGIKMNKADHLKLASALKNNETLTGLTWIGLDFAHPRVYINALKNSKTLKILSVRLETTRLNEEKLYATLMKMESLTHLDLFGFYPMNMKALGNFIKSKTSLRILNIGISRDIIGSEESAYLLDALEMNTSLIKFNESAQLENRYEDGEYQRFVEFCIRRNLMNFIGIQEHFQSFSHSLRDLNFQFI